jgi:DNA polymerase-3 subunit delta
MKINADQLETQLKKNLASIYCITGEEILLVQETIAQIRQATQQAGFVERQSFTVDNNFDWDQFLLEVNSLSLFSDKTLLELNLTQAKFNDPMKNAIEIYLTRKPRDKILMLIFSKLDSKQQTTSWFKQLEQNGVVITLWPITGAQLPAWIQKRLQQTGLTADAAGVRLLAEMCEGNLLSAHQAIEKLRLLHGNSKISAADISAAIHDNARFDVFTFVDQLLQGEAQRVLRILAGLHSEGTEATLILWAITRELRVLAVLANAMQQGQSFEQAANQERVWEKRKLLVKRALQRLPLQNLYACMQHAAHIDATIKGAEPGDVWDELRKLCLSMT